jgi:hypothetical protein
MFPELPYTCHSKNFSIWNIEFVFVPLLPIGQILRLLDGTCRNDAASLLKGVGPELCFLDSFGTSIEEESVGEPARL